MVFVLEPEAGRNRRRVKIGGALIVTQNGVEELNKVPTEMRVVD